MILILTLLLQLILILTLLLQLILIITSLLQVILIINALGIANATHSQQARQQKSPPIGGLNVI
jgi:hypothetical protein